MTEIQSIVYEEIKKRWEEKGKGTYVNRKNSRSIYLLAEHGHVTIWPCGIDYYGNEAFPSYVK